MFVPHDILQKNSKLTPEEYKIMKEHALYGYNICMADPQLQPYCNGPLYHHEALDGSGYPYGRTIDDIPLEGQIIRVADEYDAIVNKRQYKTHIGISDTLKIIIENSNPKPIEPNEVLDKKMKKIRKKYGKVNKKIVVQLLKIVISDIEYEISCIKGYVDFLEQQIKRLETIDDYNKKIQMSNSEQDKQYYYSGMQKLFDPNENISNYSTVLSEYRTAYNIRKEKIDNLYNEVDIIKHLRV